MIVEVLSPSTEDHDRGRKVPDYREIPSLQEILVVASQERRVELWRREGDHWRVEDLIGEATVAAGELRRVDTAQGDLRPCRPRRERAAGILSQQAPSARRHPSKEARLPRLSARQVPSRLCEASTTASGSPPVQAVSPVRPIRSALRPP